MITATCFIASFFLEPNSRLGWDWNSRAEAQNSFLDLVKKRAEESKTTAAEESNSKEASPAPNKGGPKIKAVVPVVVAASPGVESQEKATEMVGDKAVSRESRNRRGEGKPPVVERQIASAPNASGTSNTESLILNAPDACFVIEFDSVPGEMISCTKSLPLKYTQRDCKTSDRIEVGKVDALVSCADKTRFDLKFRTSKDVVNAELRFIRTQEGRSGVKTQYIVTRVRKELVSFMKLMPEPELLPLNDEKPDESPLETKYSGFVSVEYERTEGFGYGLRNQDQSNWNIFANLNLELKKDKNRLITTFEIGEIFFGDDESGGRVGSRYNDNFEIRNIYGIHDLLESVAIQGGLITTNSDPRGFIFSDHVASVQANYKTDLSEGIVWYGNAKKNRPKDTSGTEEGKFSDEYFGASGSLGFLTGVKGTAFALYRRYIDKDNTIDSGDGDFDGNSDLYWAGGTFDYEGFNPLAAQVTYIHNWGKVGAGSNSFTGYLVNTKLSLTLAKYALTITAEGLVTSANKDKDYDHFYSTVGLPFLLTIATSDGADDAPGSPKSAPIGVMGNSDGLQLGVLSASYNFTKRMTLLLRYGYLQKSFKPDSGGQKWGSEYDL